MICSPTYRHSACRRCLPILLLVLFLLPSSSPLLQPDSTPRITEYRLERISSRQGLPHSIVYSILVDKRGFLWMATRDGLARYDGYTFTTYGDGVIPFQVLTEDRDANIWAGTPEQLCRFNRKAGTFISYQHNPNDSTSLSSSAVQTLITDGKGRIWIGTSDGLNRYDPASDSFIRELYDPDTQHEIRSMLEDAAGNLWLMAFVKPRKSSKSETTLYRRSATDVSFRQIPLPYDVSGFSNTLSRLFIDRHGYICIVISRPRIGKEPRKAFLVRIAPHTLRVTDIVYDLSVQSLREGLVAPDNRYDTDWTAPLRQSLDSPLIGDNGFFLGQAVYSHNGERMNRFTLNYPPLYPRNFKSLQRDQGGLYWAGSDDGLFKIAPVPYFFPAPMRIPSSLYGENILTRIRSIYRDRRGDLWLGTDNQLLQYHAGSERVTDHTSGIFGKEELQNQGVNAIYETPSSMLIGTNIGLFRYDHTSGRFFPPCKEAMHTRVRALQCDTKGNLWVGTYGGLLILTPENRLIRRQSLGLQEGHLRGAVWELTRDSRGRMWIGTQTALYRWDSMTAAPRCYLHLPDNPHSLPKGPIWSIYEDRHGTIWAGVYGGGLARYRPETDDFTRITTAEGLPSNNICGLLEDLYGNLWISSSKGLARYTCNAGNNRTTAATDEIVTYTRTDGLDGDEFALQAAWRDPDGTLFFGGINQITRFDPGTLRKNPHVPPLAVTSFRANDSLISLELLDGDSVVLSYRQNHLQIEFAALDYLNPEGNLYAYKLEGIDKEWTYSGNRRYASYSGIDPGRYVLHIRGANSHGVWNYKGIRIYITLTPPVWETLWFRCVVLSVLLCGGYLWYRSLQRRRGERTERQIIEAKLQALRLQMKPHFIFNSLNSIHSFILLHKSDEASAYLSKFARLMRIALYHSQHSFISLHDELQFLQLYLELEQGRFDNAFTYEIILPPDLPPEGLQLPSMLVQPYVENAIHHGLRNRPGGRIVISFERRGENVLLCVIRDNGIGRKKAEERRQRGKESEHRSMGTTVTQQRLELLNSIYDEKFHVTIIDLYDETEAPAGTQVELSIPFRGEQTIRTRPGKNDHDRPGSLHT